MAIAGGDGSIILTTKVDTSGMEKGTASLKSQAAKLAAEYRKAGLSQSEAFKKAWSEIERTKSATDKAKDSAKKFGDEGEKSGNRIKKSLSGVTSALSKIGGLLGATFGVYGFVNFSKQAGEFATQTEASVQRLIDIYGSASKSIGNFIDQNARALGMSRAAAAEFSAVYGNLFSVWADQETNAELTNQYLNTTAVVASKTGRTMQDVQERIRSGLLGNTEAVEDLGIFVNIKTIEMTEAFKRVADGRSWAQLNAYEQSQVRTLAILEQATNKYGSTVANTTALTRSRYQAAFEDFKNTWGQVVNKILIPVLRVATAILNVLTRGMQIIAGLAGGTVETTDNFKEQEVAIGGAVDNQEALTDAVKETAKAQEKTLAGFDKINKLTDENASSSGGSGGGGGSAGGAGSITLPEMDYDNSFVDKIDEDLAVIMGTVGLALVAIGLILLFHGNIAWGIGFIIGGAATVAVTMASVAGTDIANDVIGILSQIMGVVGGALVAIGIILIMLGSTATGVGFIVAGAFSLIGSVGSLVAFDVATVENVLKTITGIASGALLALGVMLCVFNGPTPVSIGLIAAGAVSLASSVALNFDAVKTAVTQAIESIMTWIKSYGLLVIGVLLCFTGVGVGLGIPLIKKGVSNFTEAQERNWEVMKEKFSSVFESITKWVKTYGLLVLGILLCFSGIGVGIGVALISKGAKNLAEAQPRKWETIKERVSKTFDSIMKWLKTYGLLVLGVVLCFTGIGVGLGMALIYKGAKNLAESKDRNWNIMYEKVKEVWGKIKTYWDNNIAKYFTKSWWSSLAKNIANGFIGGIEGMINGCINGFEKMINWIVNALNKIHFDVPDWVPSIGGKRFGFNLKSVDLKNVYIPRLAQGAVIPPNREFLAVLGDQKQGTNIETPLKTMIEAFNIALDQRGNDNNGDQTILVTLDGEVLFRNVVKKNKNYTIATGVNPLGV